jgi:8-oxo-dGTP pyrophosphatase MutT (NUDIX family)
MEQVYQPTSVFLLLFEKPELHLLAVVKTDNIGYPWRNQVALPGGHVDKNDGSPLMAAYRELKEELNIDQREVEFICTLGHFQTIKKKDIEVFTGIWKRKELSFFDTNEISRVLEIPLSVLIETHEKKGYHGRIPPVDELVYPFDDVVIWGVTAKILHFFMEKLRMLYLPGNQPYINDWKGFQNTV